MKHAVAILALLVASFASAAGTDVVQNCPQPFGLTVCGEVGCPAAVTPMGNEVGEVVKDLRCVGEVRLTLIQPVLALASCDGLWVGLQVSADGGSTWSWPDGTVWTDPTGEPRVTIQHLTTGTSTWSQLVAGVKVETARVRVVYGGGSDNAAGQNYWRSQVEFTTRNDLDCGGGK